MGLLAFSLLPGAIAAIVVSFTPRRAELTASFLSEQPMVCGSRLVQAEPGSTIHLHRVLSKIRALGKKAGVVLDPATPPELVEYVLHLCDVILVMTVNPGFGGQNFLPEMLPKIRRLRAMWLSAACILQSKSMAARTQRRLRRRSGRCNGNRRRLSDLRGQRLRQGYCRHSPRAAAAVVTS